ncbi:MAG: hypothetical protein QF369_01770 [Dehalococcoidales bacterium]|nr:hypothetical protein [Dehalococcoidales bacterium]
MAMPSINAITVEKGRTMGMGSVMGVFNMAISLGLVTGSMSGGVIDTTLGLVAVFRVAALSDWPASLYSMYLCGEVPGFRRNHTPYILKGLP